MYLNSFFLNPFCVDARTPFVRFCPVRTKVYRTPVLRWKVLFCPLFAPFGIRIRPYSGWATSAHPSFLCTKVGPTSESVLESFKLKQTSYDPLCPLLASIRYRPKLLTLYIVRLRPRQFYLWSQSYGCMFNLLFWVIIIFLMSGRHLRCGISYASYGMIQRVWSDLWTDFPDMGVACLIGVFKCEFVSLVKTTICFISLIQFDQLKLFKMKNLIFLFIELVFSRGHHERVDPNCP